LQRMQEHLGATGAALPPRRVEAQASVPAVVNAKPEPPQSEYASTAARVDALGESKTAPAKTNASATGSPLYNEGMTLVRAERGEEGRKMLNEFLAAEPNSFLVPNALYWIGESHYLDKNYAQGILSFKEVTRRFPKHHKAAAALLKIGMSYAMLGEKDNATLYLRALLQDFPKSEPAPMARKKLAELGR
ncbi:MAG: tol-pal system protein YbgF, partial [Desulfovibrio sp.]|nr:tol-pal system protein YbgF [Desulfovibrio sp.]